MSPVPQITRVMNIGYFFIGTSSCLWILLDLIFLLYLTSQSSKEALSEVNATGVAMLFSAGTFLYVATVHVLPEVGGMGHSHKPDPAGGRGLSRLEVAALVLGCLIPLALSVGHQHWLLRVQPQAVAVFHPVRTASTWQLLTSSVSCLALPISTRNPKDSGGRWDENLEQWKAFRVETTRCEGYRHSMCCLFKGPWHFEFCCFP